MFGFARTLLKAKASIFAGTQKLISMNDRRIVRKPGNPVRKYPYHGAHTWNYRKKYMCLDYQNADENTSTSHFVISYNPELDAEVTSATERALLRFLPGCKVSRLPSKDIFKIVRSTDKRTIMSTGPFIDRTSSEVDALLSLDSASDLIDDLSNMQKLIDFARF